MPQTTIEVSLDPKEIERIQNSCTRFLAGHYRLTPRQELLALAENAGPDELADRYGAGELIAAFEREIADLLGKEQAVFMPSGTMCQQIALRIWAERRKTNRVAFHPTCHLEIHEQKGYQALHGLQGVLVGAPERLITLADLKGLSEPLAVLLLELPQREIGGQLPAWEDLQAQVDWAHEHGMIVHMDGARLWESQPFYERSYAEIAGLFDSVYVSFYKGLGGIAGSALAGPADLIAEARIWQRRHGGNLIRLYPYVLSARKGLHTRLARMPDYHRKALAIAQVLQAFPQIELAPDPPHTNMMHIYFRGDRLRLEQKALEIAQQTGAWLFSSLTPSLFPNLHKLEVSVGGAALDLPDEEIKGLFEELLG